MAEYQITQPQPYSIAKPEGRYEYLDPKANDWLPLTPEMVGGELNDTTAAQFRDGMRKYTAARNSRPGGAAVTVQAPPVAPPNASVAPVLAGPAQRSADLAASRDPLLAVGASPEFAAALQPRREEGRKGLVKDALAMAIPALVTGGGSAVANTLITSAGKILPKVARAAVTGAAGYSGEKLAQEVGVSEGGAGSAVVGALTGAVPSLLRKAAKPPPQSAVTMAAAAPVSAQATNAQQVADNLYSLARGGADINADTLLAPLESAIMRETNRPNADRATVAALTNLWSSMVDRVHWMVQNRGAAKAGAAAATGTAVAVPGKSVEETSPVIDRLLHQLGMGSSKSAQLPTTTTARGSALVSRDINPENLVDDIKQLQGLTKDALRSGRGDLAKDLQKAYHQMAGEVPYMSEGDTAYGQYKRMSTGAKVIRGGGSASARVANLLDNPSASRGMTAPERQLLTEMALQRDQIGMTVRGMLSTELGRKLLRAGISPSGAINRPVFDAALQLGRAYLTQPKE